MDLTYLQPFIGTETPFMLLFVALFFYVIRNNQKREERLNKRIDDDLSKLSEDLHVLMQVWKILLEKEVQNTKEVTKNDGLDK
jgi:hypothetical protein